MAVCGDARIADQAEGAVKAVEEEPHIADEEGGSAAGFGLRQALQPLLDVLFALRDIQMLRGNVPQRIEPFLLVFQPQQGTGVSLGEFRLIFRFSNHSQLYIYTELPLHEAQKGTA